jgi:GntR family transcriptional repressor for pyruvate dehydrogenase complex
MTTNGNGAQREKAAAVVAAELRRRIATGELKPGDRLPPEDGLMEEFDLARTTLREALRILESEGIIAVHRGRSGGPRVTSPPIDRLARGLALHLQLDGTTFGDLDDARQLIEPQLAAAMARNHTDADLDRLEDAIADAVLAVRAGDRDRFGQTAAAVHEVIFERGGNATLAVLARMLHEVVEAYYRLAVGTAEDELMERAIRSYRKLRRYIEAGDAEGAAEHWRQHMAFTIDRLDRDRPIQVFARP